MTRPSRTAALARRPSRSRILLAVAATAASFACRKPRPAAPVLTVEEKMLAAADLLLECMSSAGLDCVPHNSASDAWSAHGDLELIAKAPPALLPKYLAFAATELPSVAHVRQRAIEQSVAAVPLARGLTCKSHRARHVGSVFAARRDVLAERAGLLGLDRTLVGADLAVLIRAAAFLDQAWLVEARCAGGTLYVLVAPTRTLAPDDDPAAYPAGEWEAIVASPSPDALLLGYPSRPPPPGPQIIDQEPAEAIDPWLPVTRLDL